MIKAMVLIGAGLLMLWLSPVQAVDVTAAGETVQQNGVSSSDDKPLKSRAVKSKGRNLFWIVLALALLFVLGSALSLNALGGKQPQSRREKERGQERGKDR